MSEILCHGVKQTFDIFDTSLSDFLYASFRQKRQKHGSMSNNGWKFVVTEMKTYLSTKRGNPPIHRSVLYTGLST